MRTITHYVVIVARKILMKRIHKISHKNGWSVPVVFQDNGIF